MVQLGQCHGLFAEVSTGSVVTQSARRQNLQCYIALKLLITGAVNHTHPSGGYFFQDAVVAECLANHEEGPALANHVRLTRLACQREASGGPLPLFRYRAGLALTSREHFYLECRILRIAGQL